MVKIMKKNNKSAKRNTNAAAAQAAKKKKNQEMTVLGGALRSLGGLGGAALGGLFGAPSFGSAAGTSLGAAISKWLGSGDYEVSQNSVVTKASTSVPMMHKTDQSVIIRNREFIGAISGASSFTNQLSLPLNPGMSQTFPWLSGVAARFQEYKIRGLVFHYVPTSGTAVSGTNSALGSVMFQTSYRATDSAPTSKAELLNEYWSSESVPSEAFCHPIECDPKENPFNVQYVRTENIPAEDSRLMYDLGTTYVAVAGQQGTNTVGDLWVTYEVELKKPVTSSNVTLLSPTMSAVFTSPTSATVFPSTYTATGSITVASVAAKTITFNPGLSGTFLFCYTYQAATSFSAADLSGTVTYTNAVIANYTPAGSVGYLRTILSGGTPGVTTAMFQGAFTVTDSSQAVSVTIPSWVLTGTATYGYLNVAQWYS